MSPYPYTEAQLFERPAIDGNILKARGWVSFVSTQSSESYLREQLLVLATTLGTPAIMRTGGNPSDMLSPIAAAEAKPRSLSKIYNIGEFPLHNDTAHWLIPCRYVMLACVSPGSGVRPTMLLDTCQLSLTKNQISLLHTTPQRVTNGRNSFFSTILSNMRPFVRYDPGCMTSTSPDGRAALDVFSRRNWPDKIETIHWKAGMVIVLDNWRILHGRGQAAYSDSDRKLLRISIR